MTLANAKDLATIIGVAAAIATLFKGLWEYSRSTILRRIEYYAKMKDRFLEDEAFAKLTDLLEKDDPKLGEICARDKWRYLCFFEEVALLLKARLIRHELACYMFGYYALLCDRSRSFWSPSFPKDESYWPLFFDFVRRMRIVESSKRKNQGAFVTRMGA